MTVRTGILALLAELAAFGPLCDGGSMEIRTGAQPATPADGATGTLLGTLGLGSPAFGAPAQSGNDALLTATILTDDEDADATGTAGWFRVKTAGGSAAFDGSVSAPGGGGDAVINAVDIQQHGRISCVALSYRLPM